MSRKQFQRTRCSKNYLYKGGLTAHIRRKHPLPVEPLKKNPTSQSTKRAAQPPKTVNDLITIYTQELKNLLEDEEEFYEAAEEFDQNVGIIASMVDWFNVNFQSSFSNTNEFANRTYSVILSKNCEDCKDRAKTFEKQKELLLKQDRQLHDNHKIQKGSNEQIKNLIAKTRSLE